MARSGENEHEDIVVLNAISRALSLSPFFLLIQHETFFFVLSFLRELRVAVLVLQRQFLCIPVHTHVPREKSGVRGNGRRSHERGGWGGQTNDTVSQDWKQEIGDMNPGTSGDTILSAQRRVNIASPRVTTGTHRHTHIRSVLHNSAMLEKAEGLPFRSWTPWR